MRDAHGKPIWNLGLKQLTGLSKYALIMPNEYGELDQSKVGKDGILISWPVNPHCTGETMIIKILTDLEQFKNADITESKYYIGLLKRKGR